MEVFAFDRPMKIGQILRLGNFRTKDIEGNYIDVPDQPFVILKEATKEDYASDCSSVYTHFYWVHTD